MLVQHSLHLIFNFIGITVMVSINQAHATSCQVYPSEYAYRDDSYNKAESASANCRRYPPDSHGQSIHPEHYTHCDGTQLQLADSNLGQEQYQTTDYYWLPANRDGKLLFIFPTRVSLTTITLHYYTDNFRGLPRLRFYAVLDDFDIWDALVTNIPHVDVAEVSPGGEPIGRRNISINANFSTTKVLMYKYSSTFVFAVSEMEFFMCAGTTTVNLTMAYNSTTSAQTTSDGSTMFTERVTTEKESNSFINPISTTTSFIVDKNTGPQNNTSGTIAIGVSMAVLLILSTILIIIVVVLIWSYKRRSAKQSLYTDSSYSTLSRRFGQQIQSQSVQQDSAQLYDQIHLSPSTGQTEFFPKPESANINNPSTTLQNSHPTYSIADNNRVEHSMALNAANQATTSQQLSHKTRENTCEQPTYAAVDKSRKKKFMKKEDSKYTAAEKGPPVSPYNNEVPSASMQEMKGKAEEQEINPPHTAEELYTAVKKKPKGSEPNDKEETPPIPPHTVEELYTAVEKKSKSNAGENEEEAPPQTVEEVDTSREKLSPILQHTAENLYTAVTKNGSTDNIEAAPPIPPHTVEELYTAVMKMPKENAEDGDKAPPIPPYTVEEISTWT